MIKKEEEYAKVIRDLDEKRSKDDADIEKERMEKGELWIELVACGSQNISLQNDLDKENSDRMDAEVKFKVALESGEKLQAYLHEQIELVTEDRDRILAEGFKLAVHQLMSSFEFFM